MMQGNNRLAYLSDQITIWGPRVLVAILILIVTHFVARAVRWGLIRLMDKIPLLKKGPQAQDGSLAASMGTLGYWLVWLVGLLVALQPLGLDQAMAPINALTKEVFTYLPRIIGAAVIFFVGVLIARIVRTIVETALGAVNWSKICARLGKTADVSAPAQSAEPAGERCGAMVRAAGMLAFTIIIIPVAISALQTLGISSIVEPTVFVLQTILDAIPRIFAAALLLAIAYFIAQWVRGLIEQLLASTGFDRALTGFGGLPSNARPSYIAGWIALVTIMLFAAIEAAGLLKFELVAVMLGEVTELGGQVVFGSVIVLVGVIMARLVAKLVGDSVGESGLPSILKYAIIALAIAMGLRFMGLANEIVNLAFGLILGSAAVACALAFGLGGRETAHQVLQRWLSERGTRLPARDTAPPPDKEMRD